MTLTAIISDIHANQLALEAVGGQAQVLGTYEIEPGETMIIIARTLGGRVHASTIGGLRLDVAEPGPESGEGVSPPVVETPVP